MKKIKATKIRLFMACFLIILCLISCSKEKDIPSRDSKAVAMSVEEKITGNAKSTTDLKTGPGVTISKNKEALKKYYELPHIKEFYEWQEMAYTPPPDSIYSEDLSTLTYADLRLLRNEIFARNGYLFNDGFLRGYFNRFKWYMPIFDVDTFKVILNEDEQNFINTILREENRRKDNRKIATNELILYNSDLIVNYKQFVNVPSQIRDDLKKQNFSIVATDRSMPFYVYDDNAYQYIPHYITTDLYLFILHKYFSRFLEKLDENFMYSELTELLNKTFHKLSEFKNSSSDRRLLAALDWAEMYNALALYACGDSSVVPTEKYKSKFEVEKQNIDAIAGNPAFIQNQLVNYAELKPRGHYTKSSALKKYFKGFKWISLNGIDLGNDDQLMGMIAFAYTIKNNANILKQYERYIGTIEKLAGQEDNLSLADIIKALPNLSLDNILSDENMRDIRAQLHQLDKEKVKRVFGESFQIKEKNTQRVYFLSSTYSISGEIFSNLVHIDWTDSKRPFPKGLDIPAVFGNQTAQDILIHEYKEDSLWPDYLPKLQNLQNQFRDFNNWDHNYGFIGLKTALASCSENANYPDYMKTDAYNRKELSTALASWTHIKHDLILYQEKPFAAECGQGGGPEPPQHYSYVEPNLEFWDSALELVDWLSKLSRFDDTYLSELKRIQALGSKLKTVAYKQVSGEEVTKEEYNDLHYIGGTIEYILLALLETDHLPERERSMALIADVYAYNERNLNVAIGQADDIYVVVPIKDEYYIARGSVFSYYEFLGKIYDDDEWRSMIKSNNKPARPDWLKQFIDDVPSLEGQMQFRY